MVIEDDQRKPDIAVQLADKMIQSEKVDVLTGIIWSNLAMAVVPAATAQGKFYLSPNAGRLRWRAKAVTRTTSTWPGRTTTCTRRRAHMPMMRATKTAFILAPNYPAGKDALTGYKRMSSKAIWRVSFIPSWVRPIMRQRLRKSVRQWCGQRVFLPAWRHGDFLPEAICGQRRGPASGWSGVQL